ncbi:MAG: hypothetical protein QOK88_04795 [Nitrososphaeraceae archaeon]|nr:hypothetical protein [Nitrososphaeraceae archaeon]
MVKKEVVWEVTLGVLFSILLGFFIHHLETIYYNIVTPEDIHINGLVDIVGFVGIVGFTIVAVLLILRLINYLKNRKKSRHLSIQPR